MSWGQYFIVESVDGHVAARSTIGRSSVARIQSLSKMPDAVAVNKSPLL